ncbi:MAG: amidohydrolase family protein [Bacteroidetes bacterium]|nr:amidohydrolase family protein [Bacteroidota bacterium]
MKNLSAFLIPVFFILFSTLAISQNDYADLILVNGKIITVDGDASIAQAVAVKDSLILAVGTNAEILAYQGPETDTRNLSGRTVTPGMIDAHLHLMYYGQAENDYVNLRHANTISEVVQALAARVALTPEGEWIIGDGYFKLEDMRMPTKWDLDSVSPNNPIFLNSQGGHYGSANSEALRIAGIDADTPDPVGGIIQKDSVTGEPAGIFWNHPAMDLVRYYIPPLDEDDLAADVIFAQELCLTTGITSYQDVNTRGRKRVMGYYKALDSLKARAFMLYTIEKTNDINTSLNDLFVYKGPWLSLGGDKFLLDGQPPTSYTYEPHPGPSWDLPTWDPDTLEKVVKQLHRAGHQIAFHCMGDHAIDLALDIIEAAQADSFRLDHRHRLEHCMIPSSDAIVRMKELGVVVSLQPSTIYSSALFYLGFWGQERASRFMPMRSLLDRGIPVALGTDYPTIPNIAPKYTLWTATTRMSETGHFLGFPERVSIQEALYAQTMGSAYAAFEEDIKGSIEVGKYADMVVWSDDMYSIPVNKIKDLYVISTIVAGIVYNNPNVGIEHYYEKNESQGFELKQNYPNPFSEQTNIAFEVPKPSHVQINILNNNGQFVKRVMDKILHQGKHKIVFDASQLASGIYFIQMKTERFTETKEMYIVK